MISPKLDEIDGFILHDLHSGATLNEIIGAYDNPPRKEVVTCLFKCGNERYLLQVKAPDYKAKLFGEAGGR